MKTLWKHSHLLHGDVSLRRDLSQHSKVLVDELVQEMVIVYSETFLSGT